MISRIKAGAEDNSRLDYPTDSVVPGKENAAVKVSEEKIMEKSTILRSLIIIKQV